MAQGFSPSDANQALEHFNASRWVETIAACDEVLRLHPDAVALRYISGVAHLRLENFLEAEILLKDATRQTGFSDMCVKALAEVLHKTGRWDEEQALFRAKYQTNLLVLPYLELDIAYACNLKCKCCGHYSNYTNKGWLDFEEGSAWLTKWSKRVFPLWVRLLGGEPTLNPRLCDYITFVAELWPKADRQVVSNGFFVDRHPDLYETLARTGTGLMVTIHEDSLEYEKKANVEALRAASAKYDFQLSIRYGLSQDFFRFYQGEAETMLPFADNAPEESFRNCPSAGCFFLYMGRLWKCPAVALLRTIDERFRLSEKPEWRPYLGHGGLDTDASDTEILDYVFQPQSVCAMCPSKRVPVYPAGALASC